MPRTIDRFNRAHTRPLVPARVQTLLCHQVDDKLVGLPHTHVHHRHHLEEALRVDEKNHALEPKATRGWHFLLGRYH